MSDPGNLETVGELLPGDSYHTIRRRETQANIEAISELLLGGVGVKIIKFRENVVRRRSKMSPKRMCTRYVPASAALL